MKKLMILVLSLAMLLGLSSVALADDTKVFVSIADNNGEAVLVEKPVTVTDVDGDGALTVGDALVCAHEAYFEGGAEKGIKTSVGAYGLQLDLLWVYDNGTGYGYLVNNAFSMGLGDPVKDGDYVYAYIYRDLVAWSDTYCFFDKNTVSGKDGDKVTLTLSAAGYAADYSQLNSPVEGATILVDGKDAGVVTAADGTAEITLSGAGEHVISAKKDGVTMVPPVCVATVEAAAPTEAPTIAPTPEEKPTEVPTQAPEKPADSNEKSGSGNNWIILGIICGLVLIAIILFCVLSKKKEQ